MADLIDRQTAIETVHKVMYEFFDLCDDDEESPLTAKDNALLAINKRLTNSLKALPSAQKTGTWEMRTDPYEFFEEIPVCSVCGCTNKWREEYSYCPMCGARMERDSDG